MRVVLVTNGEVEKDASARVQKMHSFGCIVVRDGRTSRDVIVVGGEQYELPAGRFDFERLLDEFCARFGDAMRPAHHFAAPCGMYYRGTSTLTLLGSWGHSLVMERRASAVITALGFPPTIVQTSI